MKVGDVVTVSRGDRSVSATVMELAPYSARLRYRNLDTGDWVEPWYSLERRKRHGDTDAEPYRFVTNDVQGVDGGV